jgi:hypothetical protein
VLAVVAGLGGRRPLRRGRARSTSCIRHEQLHRPHDRRSALLVAATARFESAGGRFPAWLLVIGRNALTTWVLLHVLVYYPAWLVFPNGSVSRCRRDRRGVCMTLVALCQTTILLGRRGIRVAL